MFSTETDILHFDPLKSTPCECFYSVSVSVAKRIICPIRKSWNTDPKKYPCPQNVKNIIIV